MVHRYFQAGKRGLGHAKWSATGFLFVGGVNMAHAGPRDARSDLLWPDLRLAASSRPVGERGHPGADRGGKKAVAGRGASGPLPKTCGTVPHGIALPGF